MPAPSKTPVRTGTLVHRVSSPSWNRAISDRRLHGRRRDSEVAQPASRENRCVSGGTQPLLPSNGAAVLASWPGSQGNARSRQATRRAADGRKPTSRRSITDGRGRRRYLASASKRAPRKVASDATRKQRATKGPEVSDWLAVRASLLSLSLHCPGS